MGSQKIKSSVCKKGGKSPRWNDTMILNGPVIGDLIIKVRDRILGGDRVIGEAHINLSKYLRSPGIEHNLNIPLIGVVGPLPQKRGVLNTILIIDIVAMRRN